MAVPLLTLNSLLPSQSLFNEIQSIHETGFFHELDSFFCCKDGIAAAPSSTQVRRVDTCGRILRRDESLEEKGAYTHSNSAICIADRKISLGEASVWWMSMSKIVAVAIYFYVTRGCIVVHTHTVV